MRKISFFLSIWIICVFSCTKKDDPGNNSTHEVTVDSLSGVVEKGPFISGSSITLFELNEQMNQTGRVFNTQINSNSGTFNFEGIELETQFAECKADGFFFNEVLNTTSSAQLTLYSFSDLNERSGMNVNILSHLERRRVKFLINEGMEYREAKMQAIQEILAIFEIDKEDIRESESLTISGEGDDNAILLAVSVILQGFRTTAELSELLATISEDIYQDGTLDNETTGSLLINHAGNLNLPGIRSHLEDRYESLGLEAIIPDFEKYVNWFIENTPFVPTEFINYPLTSRGGLNILHPSTATLQVGTQYCMTAELPTGVSLKIRLSGALWYIQVAPNPVINWTFGAYDHARNVQVFESIESGSKCDLLLTIGDVKVTGFLTIEYYINNSAEPIETRTLEITGYDVTGSYSIPPEGRFGKNILHEENDSFLLDQQYSMIATISRYNKVEVQLKGGRWETEQHESGNYNWFVTQYISSDTSQLFTTSEIDTCDLGTTFIQPGEIGIEYRDEHSGQPPVSRRIWIVGQ